MDINAIITRMVVLFLLIMVGFLANKKGYMSAAFNKLFSGFVINVTTPAMIINSVMNNDHTLSRSEVLLLLFLASISYGVIILLSKLVPPLLFADKKDANLLRFMTIFSNTGFMGFPVVAAIFGESAVFYAAIFNMPFNILVYSYGVWLISNGKQGGFDKKTLLSPCILAASLAIVLYFLDFSFPAVITQTLGYLADVTVPGAMLIIGSSLALIPLRSVFNGWRIYALSIIKLLMIPVLVYFVMSLFGLRDILVQVTVVMWAMPVATNATMLATQYGGDESAASKGVLITTLLSILTIPLLIQLLFL